MKNEVGEKKSEIVHLHYSEYRNGKHKGFAIFIIDIYTFFFIYLTCTLKCEDAFRVDIFYFILFYLKDFLKKNLLYVFFPASNIHVNIIYEEKKCIFAQSISIPYLLHYYHQNTILKLTTSTLWYTFSHSLTLFLLLPSDTIS